MNLTPPDRVRAITSVAIEPLRAFELFTQRVDVWWRRSPEYRFREGSDGALQFEPGLGGRFLESYEDGSVFVIGKITVWEPGQRLVFSWRGANYAAHESTEVEVQFESVPPGTRITVEHRGFGRLPPDHPARHGQVGRAFTELYGGWWGRLLVELRRLSVAP